MGNYWNASLQLHPPERREVLKGMSAATLIGTSILRSDTGNAATSREKIERALESPWLHVREEARALLAAASGAVKPATR